VGKPDGKNRFEDLGVDGSIILKWILNCIGGCVLVQDRDKWLAIVIEVMNLRVP